PHASYPLSLHDALPIFRRAPRLRELEVVAEAHAEDEQVIRLVVDVEDLPARAHACLPSPLPLPPPPAAAGRSAGPASASAARGSDRKSTRLNSSHQINS